MSAIFAHWGALFGSIGISSSPRQVVWGCRNPPSHVRRLRLKAGDGEVALFQLTVEGRISTCLQVQVSDLWSKTSWEVGGVFLGL